MVSNLKLDLIMRMSQRGLNVQLKGNPAVCYLQLIVLIPCSDSTRKMTQQSMIPLIGEIRADQLLLICMSKMIWI